MPSQSHEPSAIPLPSHKPHSSTIASPPQDPVQSISTKQLPSQSKFSSGPEPSHTPHSSSSADPPQSPAQSNVFPSQSHEPSAIPLPSHTPHSSIIASPPHTPVQSMSTKQLPSQSKFSSA